MGRDAVDVGGEAILEAIRGDCEAAARIAFREQAALHLSLIHI